MTHPLDGCRLKLNRASEHLERFQVEESNFFASRPYGIVGKYYPKSSTYRFHVRVFQEPPGKLGAIIGDVVHNYSSALEYIAWQLVILNGDTPQPGQTGFPIFEKSTGGRGAYDGPRGGEWLMQGMSAEHRAEIERLQPYHALNHAPWTPLAWLRRLWNIDKHRVLHTTFSTPEAIGADWYEVRDCSVTENSMLTVETLEDKAKFGWVQIIPTGPHPKVHVDVHPSIHVAFRDPPGLYGPSIEGHPVVTTLKEIRLCVERIYTRFLLDF